MEASGPSISNPEHLGRMAVASKASSNDPPYSVPASRDTQDADLVLTVVAQLDMKSLPCNTYTQCVNLVDRKKM